MCAHGSLSLFIDRVIVSAFECLLPSWSSSHLVVMQTPMRKLLLLQLLFLSVFFSFWEVMFFPGCSLLSDSDHYLRLCCTEISLSGHWKLHQTDIFLWTCNLKFQKLFRFVEHHFFHWRLLRWNFFHWRLPRWNRKCLHETVSTQQRLPRLQNSPWPSAGCTRDRRWTSSPPAADATGGHSSRSRSIGDPLVFVVLVQRRRCRWHRARARLVEKCRRGGVDGSPNGPGAHALESLSSVSRRFHIASLLRTADATPPAPLQPFNLMPKRRPPAPPPPTSPWTGGNFIYELVPLFDFLCRQVPGADKAIGCCTWFVKLWSVDQSSSGGIGLNCGIDKVYRSCHRVAWD